MRESILRFLLDTQNSDGSWGYSPGKIGALEPTAYACLSLGGVDMAQSKLQKGIEFVRAAQSSQGGWVVCMSDNQPAAWSTALAGLALLDYDGLKPESAQAADFLVTTFAKTPRHWILRISEWLQSWDSSYVDHNFHGWNWNPGTATWIEPTAYALIFLKKFLVLGGWKEEGRAHRLREMTREADELIYTRVCKEGGWNYGNSRVLGEELRPYPLTTALALIALQDSPGRLENQKSRDYLDKAIDEEKSALALSLAFLGLQVYGLKPTKIIQRLNDLYVETLFFTDIRTTSVVLMALRAQEERNCLKI